MAADLIAIPGNTRNEDTEIVQVLKDLLIRARAGEIEEVIVFAQTPESYFEIELTTEINFPMFMLARKVFEHEYLFGETEED